MAFFTTVTVVLISAVFGHINDQVEPQNVFFYDSETESSNTVIHKSMDSEVGVNISCNNLGIDETCIILKSRVDSGLVFQYQSLECEKCNLLNFKSLPPNEIEKIVLKFSSFGTAWRVMNDKNATLCSGEQNFGENSWYSLYVNTTDCILTQERKPEFIYTPLFIAVAVYLLLGGLWIVGKFLHRKEVFTRLFQSRNSLNDLAAAYSSSSSVEDRKPKPTRQRLRSLDTVRGIAIVVMIFVNYGGGKYWFFDHTLWNGLTIADVVFPWFIWMMGMSMALSLRSLLRKAVPHKVIFGKIVKRSVILFSLGLMLNTYCLVIDLKEIRIPGVLQRFSISYFVVATIHLFFAKPEDTDQNSSWAPFRDIFIYWLEWLIMIIILTVHIVLTFFIHAPDCPAGYLGPGGMHDGGKYAACTGGAAGYIDRIVLGVNHIYQRPTFKAIYHNTLPYDPEGILGFLTSIFLVFLGLQAGKILLTYQDWKSRAIRWMSWAIVTGALAMILSKVSKNDGWIPVNKNLWSLSFILATGSLAFILMTICYIVIDVQKWWTGAPFYYSGMNSILLYVGHSMTHKMFPWSWKVYPNHTNELIVDLWGTSLWVIISVWMFHIDFFVAV